MLVWLYVFLDCTHACVCRCDGDRHLRRPCVGEKTTPGGTPVLN